MSSFTRPTKGSRSSDSSTSDMPGPAPGKATRTARLASAASSPVQAKSVQATQGNDNQVVVRRGELTATGEGNDAQTRYIHWPATAASGVTLGKGYDIGSRGAQQVINELTAAGMPLDQATKISRGAGLKGQAAGNFVRQNKDSVGAISREVQYALLSTMLEQYTERARQTATSTTADSSNRNAAGREKAEGKKAGTYVMSQSEWSGLHPAMVEFLTDLIYQGGYYGWDRVAKINAALKANAGDHLKQFKAVRQLFTSGYMNEYAGKIGEGKGGRGARETWYGQEVNYEGGYRRNALRVAYLNHVISALESGKDVKVQSGAQQGQGQGQGQGQTTTQPLPNSGNGGARPQPQPQQSGQGTRYVVKSGESLGVLARKFGVSIDALKAANRDKLRRWGSVEGFEAGATITIPGGAQNRPQAQASQQYVVKSGESLSVLSQKFGVSIDALKSANRDKLRRWGSVEGFNAGETITIPGGSQSQAQPQAQAGQQGQQGGQQGQQGGQQGQQGGQQSQQSARHVVKPGESLSVLAQRFGVSIDALKSANSDKLRRWGSVEGFNAGETITIPRGGAQAQAGQQGGQNRPQPQPQQQSSGGKPPWISVAEREIGQREIKGSRHNPRIIEYHKITGGFSDDETPWCASFANWVLRQAGQSGTGSARALSFMSYGQRLSRPAYGSIAVFDWGGGKGHVGFVVGKQGSSILVLGGNQSDQVKVSSFGASQVKAYVVPPGYQVPASAYNLSGSTEEVGPGGGLASTR